MYHYKRKNKEIAIPVFFLAPLPPLQLFGEINLEYQHKCVLLPESETETGISLIGMDQISGFSGFYNENYIIRRKNI